MDTLPAELIDKILSHFKLNSDVMALAATCRIMHTAVFNFTSFCTMSSNADEFLLFNASKFPKTQNLFAKQRYRWLTSDDLRKRDLAKLGNTLQQQRVMGLGICNVTRFHTIQSMLDKCNRSELNTLHLSLLPARLHIPDLIQQIMTLSSLHTLHINAQNVSTPFELNSLTSLLTLERLEIIDYAEIEAFPPQLKHLKLNLVENRAIRLGTLPTNTLVDLEIEAKATYINNFHLPCTLTRLVFRRIAQKVDFSSLVLLKELCAQFSSPHGEHSYFSWKTLPSDTRYLREIDMTLGWPSMDEVSKAKFVALVANSPLLAQVCIRNWLALEDTLFCLDTLLQSAKNLRELNYTSLYLDSNLILDHLALFPHNRVKISLNCETSNPRNVLPALGSILGLTKCFVCMNGDRPESAFCGRDTLDLSNLSHLSHFQLNFRGNPFRLILPSSTRTLRLNTPAVRLSTQEICEMMQRIVHDNPLLDSISLVPVFIFNEAIFCDTMRTCGFTCPGRDVDHFLMRREPSNYSLTKRVPPIKL